MRSKESKPSAKHLIERVLDDPQFDSPAMAALRQRTEQYKRIEAPLLKDLQAAGFFVNSVWVLTDPKIPHAAALPILLDHFSRDYPVALRAGIARAFADRGAPPQWWDQVVSLFCSAREEQVKDGLAAALINMVTTHRLDALIDLAADETHGPSRAFFLYAIGRARDARAQAALLSFASDPHLGAQAREELKKRDRAAERRKKRHQAREE